MDITDFDFVFSTGMKKILNIKGKKDKKVNKKITDQGYNNLTLIEKFCLMRSDFFSKNYKDSRDNVIAARKWICQYYAQQFQDIDFPNFCLNVFDSIYLGTDHYKSELAKIADFSSQSELLKNFAQIIDNIVKVKATATEFNFLLDSMAEKTLHKIENAKNITALLDTFRLENYRLMLSDQGLDAESCLKSIETIKNPLKIL